MKTAKSQCLFHRSNNKVPQKYFVSPLYSFTSPLLLEERDSESSPHSLPNLCLWKRDGHTTKGRRVRVGVNTSVTLRTNDRLFF